MLTVKRLKIALIFVAILGSVNMFAQAQPSVTPAKAENVSDAELQQFADAYMAMQKENQQAQQVMAKTIEEEGLELDRFNELHKASMDPNTEIEASEEEIAMHKAAITKLEKLQPEFEAKMKTIIEDSGLSLDRYQALGAAIQADQALQQKLQGIMMKNVQG
ncbi:DUF4168 domain-containing protein [Galbibacter orientalis]|uniref:DUF4168 domain-containing protein n=1 Tax=Galbibacter orientalis TaxID=453852 RepID=UPI003080D4F4